MLTLYLLNIFLSFSLISSCLTPLISVQVVENGPLYMYLDSSAVITGFALTPDGFPGVIEASHQVHISDRLVGINNITFEGLSLLTVIQTLSDVPSPRTLYFCKNETTIETDVKIKEEIGLNGTGYLKLTTYELTKYYPGALALYSPLAPTDCNGLSVSIAESACVPLTMNLTGKYVLVMSTASCSIDQRAIMVQQSNGSGVIITSPAGERLLRYKIDEALSKEIHIPIVSIAYETGVTMEGIIRNHTDVPLEIALLFDVTCLAKEERFRKRNQNLVELAEDQERLKNVKGGVIRLLDQEKNYISSVDFLCSKPESSLTVQYYKLKILENDTCTVSQSFDLIELSPQSSSEVDYFSYFVMAPIGRCNKTLQYLLYQDLRASGVILYRTDTTVLNDGFSSHSEEIKIPIITISSYAASILRNQQAATGSLLIQFVADNMYAEHWQQLNQLASPEKWPKSSRAQRQIYNRMKRLFQQQEIAVQNYTNQEREMKLEEYYTNVIKYYRQTP